MFDFLPNIFFLSGSEDFFSSESKITAATWEQSIFTEEARRLAWIQCWKVGRQLWSRVNAACSMVHTLLAPALALMHLCWKIQKS